MCKPKNRVMCPDCKRPKILFKSESNANTFIKFNKDNLEYGGDKLRAYWCPACCGWHVSHHKYHKEMDKQTDKLIEAYKKDTIFFKKTKKMYEQEHKLIDELFNIFVNYKFKTREEINEYVKQPEIHSKYSKFVRDQAKCEYYKVYNIKKSNNIKNNIWIKFLS